MTTLMFKDSALVSRPTADSDTEGNPFGTSGYGTTRTVRGVWGTPNGKDVQRASRRDTALDAVFQVPLGADLQVDDHLVLRGQDYDVVAIIPTRLGLRAHLRANT